MLLTLDTLKQVYSEHIWLEISESDLKKAESLSQKYSNETGKNYAYMNSLVRNCFVNWLKQNLDLKNNSISVNLSETWEFVNGCAITIKINNSDCILDEDNEDNLDFNSPKSSLEKVTFKRLILIPHDNIDTEEFTIPQEWVDIPNWAGDYYLPIEIDLEAKSLHIWGYISRQSLQAKADYDSVFRNYDIDAGYLIDDLDLLWIATEICEEKGEIKSLPELSINSAENLIKKLSKNSRYSPRLDVNFEQWASLLNNQKWLRQLYCERLNLTKPIYTSIADWLKGIYTENFLTFEEFVYQKQNTLIMLGKSLEEIKLDISNEIKQNQLAFRSNLSSNEIKPKINELYLKQNQLTLPTNLTSEEALVYLLENTEDETIRWESVKYLQQINPNHPSNAIRKIIDLGIQLMGYPLALMVAVLPHKHPQKVSILLRVCPMGDRLILPENLSLMGLDENGLNIPKLVAKSRSQDAYIQLYFIADHGDRFGVSVGLQSAKITEYFEV